VSSSPELKFKEDKFCFGDSTVFRTFSFTPVLGNPESALETPYSVVITRSMANKYFGSPKLSIDNELVFQNEEEVFSFNVKAVIEDIPENSHFSFDFMASFSSMDDFMPWYNNWHFPAIYLYIETEKNADFREMEEVLASVAKENQPQYVLDESRKYHIQPLEDIHLYSQLDYEWEANGSPVYLQIFLITGLFILIVACVNFTNLSIARSVRRITEVGIRKVMGGSKKQLIVQFLSEALIYCLLAFVTAIALAEVSLNLILGQILGKNLSLLELMSPGLLISGFLLVIMVCLFSGLYPAFYLSGFLPINALKGNIGSVGSSAYLRKGLVTFQFFVSCFLITATLVVLGQVDYMKNKDLGFSKDFVVSLRLSDRESQEDFQTLKDALLSESIVKNVSLNSNLPGTGFVGMDYLAEGRDDNSNISIKSWGGDEDLPNTYGLKFKYGRTFSDRIPTDQNKALILNESACERLGWKEDAVGKELQMTLYTDGREVRVGEVIGVVEDFHFESLHSEIEPLIIYINKHPYYSDYLSVKFSSKDLVDAVSLLNEHWNTRYPDKPIELKFLDSEIESLYASEIKISKIFNLLTTLSIIISVIGLFGLSAFVAEKRTKEVGIRKVLGAGIKDIILLQVKEFILLVLIANVLVWPLIWWWGSDWLKDFAYHMDLNPMIFGVTLFSSLFIVVATLAYHAIRSTRTNPVEALRDE
jgi:putative ABC transport system permease protein